MSEIRARWGMPVFLIFLALTIGGLKATEPKIEDFINVESIDVVALENTVYDDNGCVVRATEKPKIERGDQLFVKPDISFLTDTPYKYRGALRRIDEGRNIFSSSWSIKVPSQKGKRYCAYHPLTWWADQQSVSAPPGVYVLTTEYMFLPSSGRTPSDEFSSLPFTIYPD